MLTHKFNIKNRVYVLFSACCLLIADCSDLKAQTLVTAPLTTSTLSPGQYYSNSSITLGPGFSASGATGSYTFYILPSDCFPLTTVPTAGMNYVITSVPRVGGYNPAASGYTSCQLMQTIQYIDGLGRPIQTIQVKGSPTGNDLVQPFGYDQFGRDSVSYLPYSSNTPTPGAYQPNAISGTGGYTGSAQYQFYQQTGQGYVNTTYPYAGTNYEPSPLNREVEKGAPGAAWQLSTSGVAGSGHTQTIDYESNDQSTFTASTLTGNPGSRKAVLYTATVNSNGSRTLGIGSTTTYNTGTLYLTISRDENWNSATDGCLGTTEEYKDMEGQLVLKRTYNQVGSSLQELSTYYVYDDFGHLCFVLPPQANPDAAATIPQTTLDALCYQYQYDDHGRQTAKKVPGKGWEYTVYNSIDQPVATQDANQQANNQWIYTKYDGIGRPVTTGIWTNGGVAITQAALQTMTMAETTLWETPVAGTGYTNLSIPTSATTPLTVSYYDNYAAIPAAYAAPAGASTQTRGLLTASQTEVLNTPANMLWAVDYYDPLGRNIKTYKQHYLGGVLSPYNYDAVSNTYDFSNEIIGSNRQHFNTTNTSAPILSIANSYTYDHMGRKTQTFEQINGGTNVLLSQIDYNEIGQVMTKHLHSTTGGSPFLQDINYTYNERSWLLTNIAPLFQMQLQYNTSSISGVSTTPQYNGNIASQSWGTGAAPNANTYVYLYDRLNRLVSGTGTTGNTENNINYDLQGNITTLNRYQAGTPIDQLTYSYSNTAGVYTNQAQTIADGSGNNAGLLNGTMSYNYDGNGNLLNNSNAAGNTQNKSFNYNLLNLPNVATVATGTVTYTYDATGNKLRKVDVLNGVTSATDYINGIQYGTTNSTIISFIQTEEGKAVPQTNGGYDYYYYLGDNLGNTRITFDTQTGVAAMLQQDDYYPFGMEISRGTITSPKNEYLYNKKELQEELGQYDYGARFYDPVIGRWMTIDPLAEEDRRTAPYSYTFDDPIRHTDPDGMFGEDANEEEGGGDCCGVAIGGVAGGTAGGILTAGLVAGGTVALAGTGTVIGAPVGWVVGGGIVLGAGLGAGTVWLYQHLTNSTNKEPEPTTEPTTPETNSNNGRTGKQERLKELANDDKQSSANRGWLKQEKNEVDAGKRSTMRNPPGKELAHERGREAAKGYSYKHSHLQNRADHKSQHKHDNNGRKNKERPI